MQKLVLYVGIAITILMVLFPPWTPAYKVQSSYDPNQVSTFEEPTHYRFIVLPRDIPGRLRAPAGYEIRKSIYGETIRVIGAKKC